MYKNATKHWNRAIPREVSNFAKEGKRAAAQHLNEERKRKDVVCEFCSDKIVQSELGSHLYFKHKLSECKFCRKLTSCRELHEHIKKKHGEKKYLKWIKAKEKKNNKNNQNGVIESKKHKNTLSGVKPKESEKNANVNLENCKFCNLVVPSRLMSFHLTNYCKVNLNT